MLEQGVVGRGVEVVELDPHTTAPGVAPLCVPHGAPQLEDLGAEGQLALTRRLWEWLQQAG